MKTNRLSVCVHIFLFATVGCLLTAPTLTEASDPSFEFLPPQRLDINSLRSPKLHVRAPSAGELKKWQEEYAKKKAKCTPHFAACFKGLAANSPIKPSPYVNNVYASDVNECAASLDYDTCHGVRVCDAEGEQQLSPLFILYPPYLDNEQAPTPRVYGPVSCEMTGAQDDSTQLDFHLKTALKCNAYPNISTAKTSITYGEGIFPKYYSCTDGNPAQVSTDNDITKALSTMFSTTDFLTYINTVKQAYLDKGETPPSFYEESNHDAKTLNTYKACMLSYKYDKGTKLYAAGASPCNKATFETPGCVVALDNGKKLCIVAIDLINSSVECPFTDFMAPPEDRNKTIPAYNGPNPDLCRVSFVIQ